MSATTRAEPAYTLEALRAPAEVSAALRARGVRLDAEEVELLAGLLGRAPLWPEAVLFGILWSEHCSYKSTRHLLRGLPTRAAQVVLGPGEDAGVVRLPEPCADVVLVLAHESHNHPSQVLPVEGAATGVGGIVRDVVCMGAEVVGVADALRFGDPRASVAVRDVVRGVVQGIADYGNALGVPNLGGDACFDAAHDRNCLVNVMAAGLAPADGVLRSRVPEGDGPWAFVLVGKATDESGFGGAAFASGALASRDDRGAVQLPDPFLARVLAVANAEAFARIRGRGIRAGFKDLGAGGIACATSELAAAGGRGAAIRIDDVHRVERALPPEVLLCAETQERYCWIVPESFAAELCDLYARTFAIGALCPGAGARVIGHATEETTYRATWQGEIVVDCPVEAITSARRVERPARRRPPPPRLACVAPRLGVREALLELLEGPELASREYLYRHYDSEVQGRTWLRPGEADAVVIQPVPGRRLGIAFGLGGNPRWCAADPDLGARHAVAEAARNVAVVGAAPWALTDCLNFGDPADPEVMGDLEATIRGLAAAAERLGGLASPGESLPFVSGNVSLHNHAEGASIPPSPIVWCAGVLEDVSAGVALGGYGDGDTLVLVGHPRGDLGGSAYARVILGVPGAAPPPLDLEREARLHALAVSAARSRWVRAAHDVSDGGLLLAVVEMLLAIPESAGLGLRLMLEAAGPALAERLFSESPGIVFAVDAEGGERLEREARARGLDVDVLGHVEPRDGIALESPEQRCVWGRLELSAAAASALPRLWNERLDA